MRSLSVWPCDPQVTSKQKTVSRCCLTFGQLAYRVDPSELQSQSNADALISRVQAWALSRGEFKQGQRTIVLHGTSTLDAEMTAIVKIVS
jgi:hypothetical protein